MYQLTGSGAVGRCKIPAAWASGDTWTVNGTTVPAYCGADAVDGDTIVAGRWAIFTFDGQQLNFNGGGGLSSGKLARATAKASQVLDGVPFYAGSKTLQKGTMRNNGSWPDADKLTLENGKLYMYKANGYTEGGLEAVASLLGDASASDIMQGTAASSSKGLHVAGSIVDRGNWSAQIVPGGKVTIPPGRHAGDGSVSAAALKLWRCVYLIGRMSIPVWNGITRLQAEHWLVLLALAVPLVMPPQMLLKVSALQETLYM